MTERIQGKRIYLKRLCLEDVSTKYVAWLNDSEINRYLECRFVEHTQESVEEYIKNLSKKGSNELIYGIYTKDDSRHIGNIKLGPINRHHQHAAMGLFIGEKDCWGFGYGSEAIKLLTDYAFDELLLESLNSGCYEQNIGSYKAFEKAGWKVTGEIKSHWKTDDGGRKSQILMSKAKSKEIVFPEIRGITLIGAGNMLLKAVELIDKLKIETCVILAPRHENKILDKELKKYNTLIIKSKDINKDINCMKKLHEYSRLCMCFGPAWIFSNDILEIFEGRIFNFNGIPIPNYLGGAHFTWQILNNSHQGGAYIQQITDKLDRGPIAMSKQYLLPENLKLPEEYEKYNNEKGLDIIEEFFRISLTGSKVCNLSYDEVEWEKRTYYPRLKTDENAWINWMWTGEEIYQFCNAFDCPYPGARTMLKGKIVSLTNAKLCDQEIKHHPYCYGLIIRVEKSKGRAWIAVSKGTIEVTLEEVGSPNNKAFWRPGDRLSTPQKILTNSLSRIYYSETGAQITKNAQE